MLEPRLIGPSGIPQDVRCRSRMASAPSRWKAWSDRSESEICAKIEVTVDSTESENHSWVRILLSLGIAALGTSDTQFRGKKTSVLIERGVGFSDSEPAVRSFVRHVRPAAVSYRILINLTRMNVGHHRNIVHCESILQSGTHSCTHDQRVYCQVEYVCRQLCDEMEESKFGIDAISLHLSGTTIRGSERVA